MIRQNHIIQKQFIEISFDSVEEAMGVQNEVAEVFYSKLLPRIETLSAELVGDDSLIQLDKLEIDCGTINQKNWEEEWVDQTIRQMKLKLLHADKKKMGNIPSGEIAEEEFLFFIEHGYFSWNRRYPSLQELESWIPLHGQLIKKIRHLIASSILIARRITYQFSTKFTQELISSLKRVAVNGQTEYDTITRLLHSTPIDSTIIDICLLRAFAEDTIIVDRFFEILHNEVEDNVKPLIQKIISDHQLQKSPEKQVDKRLSKAKKEEIYIDNAGLVLLHPFLPVFFEDLALTVEHQWKNLQDQYTALSLTQFLVTGKGEYTEIGLPLNKILCGFDISDAVVTGTILPDESKSSCESLLHEVISQWSVLKNTGAEALRETFLQRKGTLKSVDHGWLLQVEQRAVDILLENLPWGLGTIKLPWMKEILFVEWT